MDPSSSDQQLRNLFEVGQVTRRQQGTSIDDWVRTFNQKRDEIVNQRCPS